MTSHFKAAFFIGFLMLLSYYFASAQVQIVGEKDLSKLELVKGEISVQLHDTVSPGFIRQRFEQTKLKLKNVSISPVQASLQNVSDTDLKRIRVSPLVLTVHRTEYPFNGAAIQNMKFPDNMSEEEKEKSRKHFLNADRTFVRVKFHYSVLKKEASDFLRELDQISIKYIKSSPKSATLETPKDKEQEYMELVEKLPFVESTARIAINPAFQ